MTSIAPGTIFRSYNADKSAHNTAILLRDGRVLELKNADGSAKKTHDSYDAWVAARASDGAAVETDNSKATGIVVTRDNHGFNVDLGDLPRRGMLLWPVWCYRVLAEGAPALLTNEAVKTAFNAFVALCDKYKSELSYSRYYHPAEFYDPKWLTLRTDYPMNGFDGRFNGDWKPQNGWTKEMYTATKVEIGEAYKSLYDLIAADLGPFLERKHGLLVAKEKLKNQLYFVKHCTKRRNILNYKIDYALHSYERRLKYINNDKERVEKQLAEHSAKVAELEAQVKKFSS